jgi:hypothetical protein
MLVLIFSLAAVSATTAGAGSTRDQRIRYGVGIGPIQLGMSPTRVRQILGRPEAVTMREQRTGGRLYVEYQWDLGWWSVGFLGRGGTVRVVKIATLNRRQRTPDGLGIGSKQDEVTTRLNILCRFVFSRRTGAFIHRECPHTHANGRRTVFVLDRQERPDEVPRVAWVEVRARGCDFFGRSCRT